MTDNPAPILLLILDGWGLAEPGPGNAVSLARTPNLDRILASHPTTSLKCSGRAVGLPDGFMGNSEVGHMNIGAGRVVYQDMTRIDIAIEQGELERNSTLADLLDACFAKGGRLHLMGLVSDGGVHSHNQHLYALLRLAKAKDVEAVVHVFLDGRDTPPTSGKGYVAQLLEEMKRIGWGRVATITGRYWAMDRDKRWDRNKLAYDAMVLGQGKLVFDPLEAIQAAYDLGENDEFVKPRVMLDVEGLPVAPVHDGDGVFFFNFRADRARQIVRSLFDPGFAELERAQVPALAGMATMTEYESSFGLPAAFPPVSVSQTLGQTVSGMGLSQLRIAETEKYAHVTYFFNCGVEEPFPGEERALIPSPREVATYDLKPEMSCDQVADKLLQEWGRGVHSLAVCNLANLDMVGHTGIIEAAVKACETVDAAVGRIAEAVLGSGGTILLTADHGNAEEMLDAEGRPQTAHSKNAVPLVLLRHGGDAVGLEPGVLGDIAPTILDLWGAAKPEAMTGRSLLRR